MGAVFWITGALIAYHLVVYPVLLNAIAAVYPMRPRHLASSREPTSLPKIALIVPAHNEEKVIASKMQNLALLEYETKQLIATIYLDGCTDRTAMLAQEELERHPEWLNLSLKTFETCRGKVAVLNGAILETEAEIVALSDASAMLDPSVLRQAVSWFEQPNVGVVCAAYLSSPAASLGEQVYWRTQNAIKAAEAAVAAPMGAHGAFYLFRRSLWAPLPANTINDDFVLPMRIVLQGYDAIYDLGLVAHEIEASRCSHEFRRRVRIGAGNLQQAVMLWRLADPRRTRLAFVFCSGKALRALLPLLTVAFLISSVTLALDGFPVALLVTVVAAAGLLLAALPRPLLGRFGRLGDAAVYFLVGLSGAFVGAMLLLVGHGGKVWTSSSAAKLQASVSNGVEADETM